MNYNNFYHAAASYKRFNNCSSRGFYSEEWYNGIEMSWTLFLVVFNWSERFIITRAPSRLPKGMECCYWMLLCLIEHKSLKELITVRSVNNIHSDYYH